MLKTLILGATRYGTTYMCQLCTEIPGVVVMQSLDQLPKVHHITRVLNAFDPQLVLLEVSEDGDWRALAQELLDFRSEVPLITFSVTPTVDQVVASAGLGLRMLQAPITGEQLQEAIYRALNGGAEKANEGRVLAFVPSKGGSGATTTALGSAMVLAQRLKKRVLFIECDIASGPASLYLGLQPSHSVMEVLEDAGLLDRRALTELVTPAEGIDLLASVGRRPAHRVSTWSFQRLISRARSTYDYVFCDLPEAMEDTFDGILRAADQVVLVTAASEASRFLAGRRLTTLSQLGISDESIRVVVTRTHPGVPPITRLGQLTVSASIPNRPLLWDVTRVGLKSFIGCGLEREICSVAEMCAGEKLPRGTKQKGSFWVNLWGGNTFNHRSREAGVKG